MDNYKAFWRAAELTVLRSTSIEDRNAWSAEIRRHVIAGEVWKKARGIMLFAALRYEPDLVPLHALADGRRISFPALENDRIIPRLVRSADDLVVAPHGIREPSPQCPEMEVSELDLIFVPGLGFSPDGTRLGRGRGHYDRFLAGLSGNPVRCGVCFGCQLQPNLPFDPHDVPMDFILTENGFIPLADGLERAMDDAP